MTLFEQTLAEAATERDRRRHAANLLTRDGATFEVNPMGTMRWYLHPALERPSTRSLYVHELEVPVGSRSGRLQCQGGTLHYVLAGRGYTDLDGVRHGWEEGDVIAIPIKENGVTYQHVNTGTQVARLLVVSANLDSALGPEAGVELTVLDPSPEWLSAPAEAGA